MFNNFFSEDRALYEIMPINMLDSDSSGTTVGL